MLGAYYPGQAFPGQSGGLVVGILSIQDLHHAQLLDSTAVVQVHYLTATDLLQGHTLESPLPVQHLTLALNDLLHAHNLEAIALTQAHQLVLNDLLHAQTLDNATLTQKHLLALADVLHGHTLEEVVVIADMALTIADLLHQQTLDGTTIYILRKRKPNSVGVSRDLPRIAIDQKMPAILVGRDKAMQVNVKRRKAMVQDNSRIPMSAIIIGEKPKDATTTRTGIPRIGEKARDPGETATLRNRDKPKIGSADGTKPAIIERKVDARMRDFPR
jgi:hypothetical protein